MILTYKSKKTKDEIFSKIRSCTLTSVKGNSEDKSKLIYGENLQILKYLLDKMEMKGKVDLIYIDPPFATSNIFTMSQTKANSISRCNKDAVAYNDSLIGSQFIEFIRERLILLRELLSKSGSIYFHTDYKVGHYIKILMDEVFGKKNFLNDLTRIKCNPKNFSRKSFGNVKDMILFYSKSGNHVWNEPKERMRTEDLERLFRKVDKYGRKYTTIPVHAPGETKNGLTGQKWKGVEPPLGRHWRSSPDVLEKLDKQGLIEWSKNGVPRKKVFADENKGKKIQDILKFKDTQKPVYPTEKNYDLLKLIVKASSNPDSIVLDCFCGSGTTLRASQELGRNWIGIDNSKQAINVALNKLSKQGTLLNDNSMFEYLEQENFGNYQD